MAESYGAVSFQIYILFLCGAWPILKRPFQKHLKINVLCTVYTCIFIIIRVLSLATNAKVHSVPSGRAVIVWALSLMCDILATVSTLHICIFKYNKLLSHLKLLAKYQIDNIKIQIFLLIATVGVQGSLSFILYNFSTDLTTESFIKFSFSGTNTEAWILMVLYYLGLVINDYIILIPTFILLGISLIICEQFNLFQSHLSDSVSSKEVYTDETSFYSFKLNFEEICDTVTCLDETFKYYIVVCLTGLGIFIADLIYNLAVGCIHLEVVVAYVVLHCFIFFCLCASGAVVSQVVSKFIYDTHWSWNT